MSAMTPTIPTRTMHEQRITETVEEQKNDSPTTNAVDDRELLLEDGEAAVGG